MTALAFAHPRYLPLGPIGRGGMAEVLLALMDAGGGAHKVVVLKRIWPDLASDPDFVAMFHDEARLTLRLNHPNVVHTLEVVEDPQNLALVMEYLHGQPLRSILHRLGGPGGLSLALRLRILVDVLAGLHHAHELTDLHGKPLGVVHRDVSPDNVFVTYEGQVKLMDFGVAKTTAAASRTRPGTLKGKLPYMAPDYFRGMTVDRRADVFAAGVMLWEMLAGGRLWHGLAEPQIVHHLAVGLPMPPLPPDASRPRGLDAICARALAVDSERRYATAAELEMDLRGVLVGADDSHARTLGRVISHAFADVRVERDTLIARALESSASPDPAGAGRWTEALDDLLPTANGFFDQTVADRTIVALPRAAGARRPRVGAISLAGGLAALVLGLVVAHAQGSAPPPTPWLPLSLVPVAASPTVEPLAATPPAVITAAGEHGVRSAPVVAQLPPDLKPHRVRRKPRAAEARLLDDPFQELKVERLRPASLRAIDEADPYR